MRGTAVLAILCAPAAAGAAEALNPVVPGITYERIERPRQVIHVARVVQGPLVAVRPVLTGGAPSRRAPLTSAMGARLGDGAVVGVNGDYFNLENAYPSGLLMSGGEIVSEPEPTRSALVFAPGGGLLSLQTALTGTWQASDTTTTSPERGFIGVNRNAERASETIVYTSRYGDVTPAGTDRVDALIALDPPGLASVNVPIAGTVMTRQVGGGVGIGPGKLVIAGIGSAANNIVSDLTVGRRVTLTFGLAGLPAGTEAAIGGGPALVQNGVALKSVTEGFTSGQIATRTSRTALGQTADGTVLLVTVDGPFQGSRGMTMTEQAALLASLGAQTAVGMDGGGSSMMALRNRLVTPWSSERAIANAVIVTYAGVQLTDPARVISPNGDRVADQSATTVRSAKQGTVQVMLTRAGRTIRPLYRGPLGPAGRRIPLTRGLFRTDGSYRVVARIVPSDGSAATRHVQDFTVDRTIGFLRLRKVGRGAATALRVQYRATRPARVTIIARDGAGRPVKVIARNRLVRPGVQVAPWDLKRARKPLPPGIYSVTVESRTRVGRSTLTGRVRVTKPPAVRTTARR